MDEDARRGARRRAAAPTTWPPSTRWPASTSCPRCSAACNGRGWAGCSRATSTPTTASPTATSSTSCRAGIGLPDEAYYREDDFAELRDGLRRPRRGHAAARSAGPTTTAADGADRVMALETRLAAGHWDNVRCRDVIASYNLTTFDELQAAAPAFDWSAWVAALGGTAGAVRRGARAPAELPDRALRGARRGPARRLEGLAHLPPRELGRALPELGVRRPELRLLLPHADRGRGAARPVEARRGPVQRGHRRGGRGRVRGPGLPARGQGPDGRPGREPGRGLPHQHRPPRVDGR